MIQNLIQIRSKPQYQLTLRQEYKVILSKNSQRQQQQLLRIQPHLFLLLTALQAYSIAANQFLKKLNNNHQINLNNLRLRMANDYILSVKAIKKLSNHPIKILQWQQTASLNLCHKISITVAV